VEALRPAAVLRLAKSPDVVIGWSQARQRRTVALRRGAEPDPFAAVPVDNAHFKHALSHWGSGVCVITARAADGSPVGLTASSFSSLSLDPPLVLFCLGLDSTNVEAFQAAREFAVHILAAGQESLSSRFASRGGDKFSGLEHSAGKLGTPVLPGCLAVLECRMHAQLPGGDHIIVVGLVEHSTVRDGHPLLYFRGGYRQMVGGAG
jgi:flavin reductase ActVB